jgi:hypothetical protein
MHFLMFASLLFSLSKKRDSPCTGRGRDGAGRAVRSAALPLHLQLPAPDGPEPRRPRKPLSPPRHPRVRRPLTAH